MEIVNTGFDFSKYVIMSLRYIFTTNPTTAIVSTATCHGCERLTKSVE